MKITDKYVKDLINQLNDFCFCAGTNRYAKQEGINIEDINIEEIAKRKSEKDKFAVHVNWSFKQAQKIIIRERLKIEHSLKSKTLVVTPPYTPDYVLALLRDYADCLGWILLKTRYQCR